MSKKIILITLVALALVISSASAAGFTVNVNGSSVGYPNGGAIGPGSSLDTLYYDCNMVYYCVDTYQSYSGSLIQSWPHRAAAQSASCGFGDACLVVNTTLNSCKYILAYSPEIGHSGIDVWLNNSVAYGSQFNWSATPLTGTAPLTVAYTIQNSTHSYTVAFGDGNITNMTAETFSHIYQNAGVYSPTISIRNTSTSITRTNYITVSPQATGNVTTYAKAIDGNGYRVYGAAISLKDVENSSWSNTTSAADGQWAISTLPNHTINAYATYTGNFSPASYIGFPVGNGGNWITLQLFANTSLPSIGNTSLSVSVIDIDWVTPIKDATVTVSGAGLVTTSGTTNTGGSVVFIVPNQTSLYVTAKATGYDGVTQVINSGPSQSASTVVALHKASITQAPTQTPLPGQSTVAPTQDPHDPAITGNTNAKAQDMMNYLAMNGMDLVQLAVLMTILAFLGVKFGGK